MKKTAFTCVDDRLFYPEGTHILINSFVKYHPDIDLVVFRQTEIEKLFKKKNINWYQAKPHFAELLFDYDLIVNIDADTIITGRLTEVFDNVDYEVGCPWNFNEYENASFENITEKMYLQAGMVASTSKLFWKKWQKINETAMDYIRKENDTLNLLVYNDPEIKKLKLKIFDKKKDYYGCKSLGGEPLFYIDKDRLMYKKQQVRAYHFARGNVFPKLDFDQMPLTTEVREWMKSVGFKGNSIKVKAL